MTNQGRNENFIIIYLFLENQMEQTPFNIFCRITTNHTECVVDLFKQLFSHFLINKTVNNISGSYQIHSGAERLLSGT